MNSVTPEEPAIHLNLDRTEWKSVKFGDIAIKQNESVDRETTTLKRYIAGEHMRSEDLHLREWGDIGDDYLGPAFTRKFSSGDILYGSRRTYLKKVAVAHFDGITANTTFVIKANEELIVKELLPFIMLSEGFTQHSIRNSKGSVNPYINWKDIANYEFLLPPKDQQAKLTELLWAADAVVEEAASSFRATEKLHQSIREHDCLGLSSPSHVHQTKLKCDVSSEWAFSPLREHLCDMRYGTSKKGNRDRKGYSVVGIPHVINETLVPDDESYVELPEKEFETTKLARGDILIVRTNGNPRYTGRSALFSGEAELVYASYLIKISADPKIFESEYLVRYLQTQASRRYFFRHATSSAGNYNINTEDIGGLPVPRVPLQEQRQIVEKLKQLENALVGLSANKENGKRLLKSLINEIFSQ